MPKKSVPKKKELPEGEKIRKQAYKIFEHYNIYNPETGQCPFSEKYVDGICNSNAPYELGERFFTVAAMKFKIQRNVPEGPDIFNKLVELYLDYEKPSDEAIRKAGSLNSEGLKYRGKGDLDAAIIKFEKALELDRLEYTTCLCLATTYYLMNDYETAEKWIWHGLLLNPTSRDLLKTLSYCFEGQGDFWRSFHCNDTILINKNQNNEDLLDFARINLRMFVKAYSDTPEGEKRAKTLDFFLTNIEAYSNECLKIGHKPGEAYFIMAKCLELAGNYKKAVEFLKKALEIDGPKPHFYLLLGLCYANSPEHDNELAIEYLEKCIEIGAENYDARKLLANLKGEDFDEKAIHNRLAELMKELNELDKDNDYEALKQTAPFREMRKIGEDLHNFGGIEAMRQAFYAVHEMDKVLATPLEAYWSGVGDWRY